MTQFKKLKTKLQNNGYAHQWKLMKTKDIETKRDEYHGQQLEFDDKVTRQTTKPLCQNIDLIVPLKNRTSNQKLQLEHFFSIIGTELHEQASCFIQPNDHHLNQPEITNSDFRRVERNDEKRQFRIQEFIKTEKSYVDTLKTIVKYVVNPLRANMQQKNSILNTFKCQKIFLNIDQIMQVNNDFLKDLLSIPNTSNFGILCEKHINKFECYRKYLLEQSEAQKLHAKEYKTNQSYKRFISKVKEVPAFKRKRLQDILVEPVQRISRYSMMLRDILQLTPEDHPEFRGLKAACEKASEIATMADDDPTKTATMFLNLYQAIKDSPCSLINQKRSLIAHLDAIEIHRVTNKPTRAVSIFLFTDKILVASRSSIDAKEINLQQILDSTNTICPTNSSSASLLFSSNSNHHKSDKHHLKFKGWVDIESIEMFEGVPERQGSFILSATSAPETQRDEVSNITSFEKYFYKGPRLFTVIPTREENSLTKAKRTSYVEKMLEFRSLFQKTRALMKRYEPSDKTYHRVWNGVPVYCNVYSQESYTKARYKNDSTVIYVDGDDQYAIEPEDLFSTRSSLYNPWVVSLIQPEEMKGFRFNICTKTSFPTACIGKKSTENTTDFERIFWNNIFYLNQCLKRSQDYATHSILRIQQALSHNVSRSRSKSKSISRTSSIPSIGKLFHNNSGTNNSRPRSVSPSRMLIKSSKSTQSLVASSKYAPVHHSWSSGSVSSSSHPDSYRHNSSSVTTLASSLWSTPSSYHLPQVNSGDAKEEDQHTNNSPEQQSLTTDRIQVLPTFVNKIKPKKPSINTISSIDSDTSTRSTFSMIEDFEEGDINYMTLDIKKSLKDDDSDRASPLSLPSLPTPVPTPPNNDGLNSILFKSSIIGFEDEMQQQWNQLVTKYELLDNEFTTITK